MSQNRFEIHVPELPFTHNLLGSILADGYDIDTLTSFTHVEGQSDTYLADTPGGKFVLRVYRGHFGNISNLESELAFLLHLHNKGVGVSIPLRRRDGNLAIGLSLSGETRQAVLFTYAPGRPLSESDGDGWISYGRTMAAIHKASEDFKPEYVRCRHDLEFLLDAPAARIKPLLAHRTCDYQFLLDSVKHLRNQVQRISSSLNWGMIHGDLGGKNIHFSEDWKPTVFDFLWCGLGWRAYEIATFRRGWGRDESVWTPFLRGYRESRDPSSEEMASIPYFVAVAEIWLQGNILPIQSPERLDAVIDVRIEMLKDYMSKI
jgi:Ser/Thr protein kinase RdoA (MazF antagonist)